MILSKKYLNEQFQKGYLNESAKLNDSALPLANAKYDIFFSYSFADEHFALGIVQMLRKHGYSVYMDSKDDKNPNKPVNRETVEKIAKIMDKCSCLIYMHTRASTVSKWCPWELGYISGKKNFRCATIPLVEDKEKYDHQEYLKIYPYVQFAKNANTQITDFYVFDTLNERAFTNLRNFINGTNP